MTDIKYTVVMKKKKINGELYILVPQKLIKGTLDTTNGNYFYAEDKETFYDFSESSSITNPQVEELVAYTISENYLLQKYPNVDIEEAKKDYFKRIDSAVNIAFYLQNINATGIIPLRIHGMINKLNNIQIDADQKIEMDLFSDFSTLPADQYGYPLSPYELEQMNYQYDMTSERESLDDMTSEEGYLDDILEKLLKIEDVGIIHQVLQKIYDGEEDLQKIMSSLSLANMIQEAKDTSFKTITISDVFSNSCSQILSTNDKKKMIEIINQTSDFFTTIYCQFHDNISVKGQPEVETSCDYLEILTEQYKKLVEENKGVDTIHKKIKKLKKQEMDNVKAIQKNYQAVLKNSPVKKEEKNTVNKESSIINVAEAKEYLDERIIGQENAK